MPARRYYRRTIRRRGNFKKAVLAITRADAEKKIVTFDEAVTYTSTGGGGQEYQWNYVFFNPSNTQPPTQGTSGDQRVGDQIDVHRIRHRWSMLWNLDFVSGGTNTLCPAFARIIIYSPRQKTPYSANGQGSIPLGFPTKVFKQFDNDAFQRYAIHKDMTVSFPSHTVQFISAQSVVQPCNVDANPNKTFTYQTAKKSGWKCYCSSGGLDGLPDSINGVGLYVVIQAQQGAVLPARTWFTLNYGRSIHFTDS